MATIHSFGLLSQNSIEKILEQAFLVLEKVGVMVENEDALKILGDAGAKIDRSKQKAFISHQLVESCLESAPSSIVMFDINGNAQMRLEGNEVHFVPGSAALTILDWDSQRSRKAVTRDLIDFYRVIEALDNIAAQSTGIISSDMPRQIQDRYRLFLALQYGRKPVVTGTFALDGFATMKKMLLAVRGGETELRQKPLAIFDCCPSPPLKWSNLTCQNLIDCAKSFIPAELVSMPLTGATAPGTIAGALVQLAAENFSGIVIHQLTNPGAPIVWGGSPAAFDMRHGTTPMGAVETMMIDSASSQIAKYFNLPTHAYMGLSDAKLLDAQAGLESGIGAVVAVLSGINVVSGPGMLNFESTQSLEKLVIDNEICGMAMRLGKGIVLREKFAEDLFGDIYEGEHFLTSPQTLKWMRDEFYFPGQTISRENEEIWSSEGSKSAAEKAHEMVEKILMKPIQQHLTKETMKELRDIMTSDAKKYGLTDLPAAKA